MLKSVWFFSIGNSPAYAQEIDLSGLKTSDEIAPYHFAIVAKNMATLTANTTGKDVRYRCKDNMDNGYIQKPC